MSKENDSAEKSHEPTQHKIDEARRKGDVPRSMDVSAAAGFLGFFVAILASGSVIMSDAATILAGLIDNADRLSPLILGPGGQDLSARIMGAVFMALLPLFLIPFVSAVVSLLAQQAFVFAPDKIIPKLNRLSLIQNFKQKFGPTGIVGFLKSVAKMVAVTIALILYLRANQDSIFGAIYTNEWTVASMMGETLYALLAITCVIFIAIGLLDILWQNFDHTRKLRMSFQEMRDEQKQTEGDPALKQQRNQKRHDLATNRSILDVPEADVVIVNPTHFSVALKWDRDDGKAPKLVAKGVDEIALRIREIAAEHGVPIRRDPPTARAIFDTIEIGEEVNPDHYRAVAAAIRFAEAMRDEAKGMKT